MSAPSPRHRSRRAAGYTLLEVLIAAGILSLLGTALVGLLTEGVRIWRRAERRGRVYEQARVLLDAVAADLRSTVVTGSGRRDETWVRFICDHDDLGRQRLRFVRTISGETGHPILRDGGRFINTHTAARYDGRQDGWEARQGLLAAPGGLLEVFYGMDPRPGARTLWRGVRSPVGGTGSLFHDGNISTAAARRLTTSDDDGDEDGEAASPLERIASPVGDGVLFLRFSFWGPTTNTWDPLLLPSRRLDASVRSGPLFHWDSTRAILDYRPVGDELTFEAQEESLLDPSDDIFPERVEVTLTLRDGENESLTLSETVRGSALTLVLSRAVELPDDPRDRYLLVDEEWVAIEEMRGNVATVAKDGRGARGTAPVAHERGAIVERGATFRRVVEIPAHRGFRPAAREDATSGRRRLR